jgi:hypothetical protein
MADGTGELHNAASNAALLGKLCDFMSFTFENYYPFLCFDFILLRLHTSKQWLAYW